MGVCFQRLGRGVLPALAAGALVVRLGAQQTPGSSPVQAEGPTPAFGAQEVILSNGFRVLAVEDHRVPRVAASLFYRVGALQEPLGEHGSTHFLEHAIHQGTTTVGTTNYQAERPLLQEIHDTEQQLIGEWNVERNRDCLE